MKIWPDLAKLALATKAEASVSQRTRYLLCFTPELNVRHPGNAALSSALSAAIAKVLSPRDPVRDDIEAPSRAAAMIARARPVDGVIEATTPDCASPGECVFYQRAQERVLVKALPLAERRLEALGHSGRLGVIKEFAARDPANTGGAEWHLALIAEGWRLWILRCGLLLCLLMAFAGVFYVAVVTLFLRMISLLRWALMAVLAALLAKYARHTVRSALKAVFKADHQKHSARMRRLRQIQSFLIRLGGDGGQLGHLQQTAAGAKTRTDSPTPEDASPATSGSAQEREQQASSETVAKPRGNKGRASVSWPVESAHGLMDLLIAFLHLPARLASDVPMSLLLRAFAFRRHREVLPAFFASRIVFTGEGAVLADGTFALTTSPHTGIFRSAVLAPCGGRAMIDVAQLSLDVVRVAQDLLHLRVGSVPALFSRCQRLTVGASGLNRAQLADYLRVGVTMLVLEMADAGFLDDAPRLDPSRDAALQFATDPTLTAEVQLIGTEAQLGAVELQRWYLEKARTYLKSSTQAALEHYELLRLWDEVLTLLQQDPGALVGRLDWITKRYLLEAAGEDADYAALKRIDASYHELGRGCFDWLESQGLALRLVEPAELDRAVRGRPGSERPRLRTRSARELAYGGARIQVRWDQVKVGRWWRPRLVPNEPN